MGKGGLRGFALFREWWLFSRKPSNEKVVHPKTQNIKLFEQA